MFACTKFRRYRSRGIGVRARKPPQKFGEKRSHSKNITKIFCTVIYLKIPFIPANPLLAAMKIFFRNILRSSLKWHTTKKKLHHIYYCDVQTMQTNLRCANIICEISPKKKLWLLNWIPPKDLEKSTRLVNTVFDLTGSRFEL